MKPELSEVELWRLWRRSAELLLKIGDALVEIELLLLALWVELLQRAAKSAAEALVTRTWAAELWQTRLELSELVEWHDRWLLT